MKTNLLSRRLFLLLLALASSVGVGQVRAADHFSTFFSFTQGEGSPSLTNLPPVDTNWLWLPKLEPPPPVPQNFFENHVMNGSLQLVRSRYEAYNLYKGPPYIQYQGRQVGAELNLGVMGRYSLTDGSRSYEGGWSALLGINISFPDFRVFAKFFSGTL